jgi:acyl-CoA dehydrogenase
MDFTLPAHIAALSERVRAFVENEVIPLEPQAKADDGLPPELLAAVRQKAKAAGLWAPQLPVEYGGQGLDLIGICAVFEQAGRSLLGPLALHCSAPDEGNMHLLHLAATPEQKEKYLRPLAAGDIRSCFAMTEPHPGAGADPTMIQATAVRDGDRWVIDGHKWYATGGDGAAFYIVMARTNPNVEAARGCSLFLVDAGTPGLDFVRRVPGMGVRVPGGHAELKFHDCAVSASQMLGGEGQGFKLTQQRLGPARLTHCMRWLGIAQRAQEIAGMRAKERSAFGGPLAGHQAVQWMLADSALDLHASRLMVWHAAWKLQQGDEARQETSMCKVFVAEAVNRVIDRALQVCGALGVSQDLPLGDFYREARLFRIYDGPSEVHRMVIARQVLKRLPARPR